MLRAVDRVVVLLDPARNQIHGMSHEEATQRVASGDPTRVRAIGGSYALVGVEAPFVRMARTIGHPMRYFLAKRADGPALVVSDRIDAIRDWLVGQGLGDQFHPSYTRMVPAHHVLTIHLVGCPDPQPTLTRWFAPRQNALPADLDVLGAGYIGALAHEVATWLHAIPEREPVGVCFSGGIDSGAVFLVTRHVLHDLGMNPARLKAFTLSLDGGPDVAQARAFLESLGLGLYHEVIDGEDAWVDVDEVLRTVEDYKPLDLESAAMGLCLMRGIRGRYPAWTHLVDGDGGDENLKDYPIEANPELTIRSVLNNVMLYQEGWGVESIKHSPTYSGGQSRAAARTWAPAARFGFRGFSPFTLPNVIEQAEGIPFVALTGYDVAKLYALKGEIVRRGVKAVTGLDMPVAPKRRFQHGAVAEGRLRSLLPGDERTFRRRFLELYA